MGYSRQQFYEIRRNYQMYGADGLIDPLPGAKGPHPIVSMRRLKRPFWTTVSFILPTAACGACGAATTW